VWAASILLICDHARFDLPVSEMAGQLVESPCSTTRKIIKNLPDRVLSCIGIPSRVIDGSVAALVDGNCNTTRGRRSGHRDGRTEKGEEGKDKGV
jgi:hypothetical protein